MRFSARDNLSVVMAVLGQLVLVLAGGAGCQTTRIYSPPTLPVEMQGQEIRHPNDDLGKIPCPKPPVEIIEPGDLIDILIDTVIAPSPGNSYIQRSEPVTRRVREDGRVFVPEIGWVQVSGLEPPEVEQRILEAAQERQVFPQAAVTVTMKRKAVYRVRVYGAVKLEGEYELPRSASVLATALRAAGGLTEEASSNIEIHPAGSAWGGQGAGSGVRPAGWTGADPPSRVGPVRVNLAERVDPAIAMRPLEDGSLVIVDRQPLPPYLVLGQVTKPGSFPFPRGRKVRLSEAIGSAGGPKRSLNDEVTITRRLASGENVKVRASLRKMESEPREDLLIQPGDIINVEHNPLTMFLEILGDVPIGANVPIVP